ncbi:MAG: SDR family oxidoreductase [Candidatus Hydrogenedentes bacterium]|nr:SDR family oxidoreductase [Candidatus Hydrogenedentota bacterium]
MSVLDRFSLKGKVVLVTGGAGLYGRQIVRAVAEAGATAYVASRNLDSLKALADTFAQDSLAIVPMQYDQGDESSVLALRDSILKQSGRIDALVNNAVLRPMKKGYKDDAAAFTQSMEINATGLFTVSRAFGDAMADQKSGSIVNIGSIQGMIGPDPTIYRGTSMSGWYPDYFFHKGGMINFTRFLASYYGASNVRCNCLSPGGYQTPDHPAPFVEHYSDRTFLGRLGNDTDLMGAVVFLASDASAYITGVNLPVDGGYTAK